MSKSDVERWHAAAHAMQSGVALDHERNGAHDGTPKHLRVGVNVALCDHAALVRLLVEKGIFTEEEYAKAIADEMEREVERYRQKLGLGDNVRLG